MEFESLLFVSDATLGKIWGFGVGVLVILVSLVASILYDKKGGK